MSRRPSLISEVERRSDVVPVGVDLARIDALPRVRRERPLVLWNHRWEYDKGPDRFTDAILQLASDGSVFDVALAGEQFVTDPTGFSDMRAVLGDRVVHYGEADDDRYLELLRSADVVVSTALQEFFGISITEAVYAGAFPVLPSGLVYPERVPLTHHERCLYDGADDLVAKLTWALTNREEAAGVAAALRPSMAECDWRHIAPRLDSALAQTWPAVEIIVVNFP